MTAASSRDDCFACHNTARADLPVREAVRRSAHWRVAHAFDTDLPGWLVLLPTAHVTAFDELSPEAAAELGGLMRDLSAALRTVTGCTKTYVMLFAEAEGFSHLHVHLVPRMPDQPASQRGPQIFARLGRPEGVRLTGEAMDRVSGRLRDALTDLAG